jgi:hypothetical protein
MDWALMPLTSLCNAMLHRSRTNRKRHSDYAEGWPADRAGGQQQKDFWYGLRQLPHKIAQNSSSLG